MFEAPGRILYRQRRLVLVVAAVGGIKEADGDEAAAGRLASSVP